MGNGESASAGHYEDYGYRVVGILPGSPAE